MKPCVTKREGSGRIRLLTNRLELYPAGSDLLAGGEFRGALPHKDMGVLMGTGGISPSIGHLDRIRLAGCLNQVGLGSEVAFATIVAKPDKNCFAGRGPNG